MARNQIGSVWSASNEISNDTFQSLPARTITAGSLVIVVGRFENSGIATVSVSDTAGATWQVQSQFNSNIQTFIAWSYNHPGYTNDIITATYDVQRAYRNMAAIELDGSDTSDPAQVANIVKSSAVLNHSMTVSTPCDIFAIQGSYSTSEIIATSPAVDLLPGTYDLYLFSTIRNASVSPVTIANTGGGGDQASISLAFSYSGGGDTTAPTLSSATGTATGETTASGSVSTNEANGTLYRITTSSSTALVADVKAGASQAVTAAGVQTFNATGLPPGTTLYHHLVHTDEAGNDSLVATSNAFTTTAPDVTAPTLTSPTATATGSTTATGAVSTNEANGTLYFYASTNATEDVATVKASGASQAVTVTGVQGVSVIGLNGSTTYYLHFVHTDPADNDSACVSSASFTTSVAPGTAKLTLPALRNNTGTLLANEVGATVHIYEVASGNKVATVTGATSDSAGMLVVHSSSMTSGTQYRAVVVLDSGAEGLQKVTATV